MQWDLSFFYESSDDPKIKEDLNEVLLKTKQMKKLYYHKLSSKDLKPIEIKNMLKEFENIRSKLYLAYMFSFLLYAQNTQKQKAQKIKALVEDGFTEFEEITSFIKPQLLKQSKENLYMFSEDDELREYKHFFDLILESKKHVLSEDSEKVIAAFKTTSREAFADLYDKLISSYSFDFEIDGQIKQLTADQLRGLKTHKDKEIRRKATKTFLKRIETDSLVIEEAYNSIAKNYGTEARIRNFEKPIHMKNIENEAKNEIVDTVIDVTTNKTNLVHKYYKWKSEEMGEKLSLSDIYAPFTSIEKKYTFDEAKEIVLNTFYEFDNEIGDIAKSFFEEKRIHSDIEQGKLGGAFCFYMIPNYKPFILVNFDEKAEDVMTLAHELGHGIHGTLSSKQNLYNYMTPLTMAEIASVFSEILVMEKLLKDMNENDKKYFIAGKIEEMFATMFRQNMFARFEIKSHEFIKNNGKASWEDLNEIFYEELKIMFGDSVEIPEEYKHEWASIPHIFGVPFYVYAYNFANLIVLALYEKYLEIGKEEFVPKYKELLSSGAENFPENLLSKIGIDISKKEFWENGFDFLEKEFIKKIM